MSKFFSVSLKITAAVLILALLLGAYIYSQRVYLKNAYPIKYSEYVEKYAKQYDLDPYFIYAVIRTESDFQKDATSYMGARGLMQITEETYDWISGRLKDKESTFDSMYEPQKAVEYGAYLLKYLSDALGRKNVLCGYHAGVNKTKEWIDDSTITQNGEIITDKIPYDDTRYYVKKVMKTYEIYVKLYK